MDFENYNDTNLLKTNELKKNGIKYPFGIF